jgi:pre-mRNA-splicing factor SYF2
MQSAFHYVYEEEGPARERVEFEKKEDISAEKEKLNPRAKRLAELREQLRKSRNENKKAVIEEDKKEFDKKNGIKKQRLEYYEKLDNDRREAEEKGIDTEKQRLYNTTAEEAEEKLKKESKKKQRRQDTFGWEKFTNDAQYNAYNKRQRENNFSVEAYEKQKAEAGENFYRDANHLGYAQGGTVPKEKVGDMVNELHVLMKRRQSYSRRRTYLEDADVDFINERNRKFNKKLGRAYDAYTVEIKQNLERGTAV